MPLLAVRIRCKSSRVTDHPHHGSLVARRQQQPLRRVAHAIVGIVEQDQRGSTHEDGGEQPEVVREGRERPQGQAARGRRGVFEEGQQAGR